MQDQKSVDEAAKAAEDFINRWDDLLVRDHKREEFREALRAELNYMNWTICAFCGEQTVRNDDPDRNAKMVDHCLKCDKHPIGKMGVELATLKALSEGYDRIIGIFEHRMGKWLSAALEDPNVCKEMKDDINGYFMALNAGAVKHARLLDADAEVVKESRAALMALNKNHTHHQDHDYYDGYCDSALCDENTNAIIGLRRALANRDEVASK